MLARGYQKLILETTGDFFCPAYSHSKKAACYLHCRAQLVEGTQPKAGPNDAFSASREKNGRGHLLTPAVVSVSNRSSSARLGTPVLNRYVRPCRVCASQENALSTLYRVEQFKRRALFRVSAGRSGTHQHSQIQQDHQPEIQEIGADEEDLLDVNAVKIHQASRGLQAGSNTFLVLAQRNLIAEKREVR